MLDARDLTARAEMAELRASVASMETELRELGAQVKVLPGEVHASTAAMVKTLGNSLSTALPDAVRAAAERHFMRMAVERGMTAQSAQ
jgi:hypothetical protein